MEHTVPERPKAVLPDIRRACQLLGLRPEDLSLKSVLEAWKHEMSKPGVHPDTGGDPQMAASLNNAKDLLTSYLEGQVPKLGKIFKTKAPERGRKEDARDDGA